MKKSIWLQSFILVLLLAAPAAAQEKINLAYISPAAEANAAFWIGKEAGLYKKHGLDVNLIFIDGSPRSIQALLAGELQIIHTTGVAEANAKLSGGDVVLFMGLSVVLPYYLVTSPDVQKVQDLKGKVGANHIPATSADLATRMGLRSLGLDPDKDVILRSVGGTNLRMAALRQGIAQFTLVSEGDKVASEKAGFKVLVDFAQKGIPFQHTAVASSSKFLKEKRETAMRFARGIVESIYFFKTRKPETISIIKKYTRTDNMEALEAAYLWQKQYLPEVPYPSIDGMKLILAEVARKRPEAAKAEVSQFVDMSIVKSLEDSGFIKEIFHRPN
ncbi:MAG: ABC transporter substrate-binding protein [Candidatus Tectomicrobia bacterium]|uniref:ABC transporter substrate-binding protein n=1 Tax=Tectimicrobiota bacterium TaxID=2528274 RepID=A0A932M123_UNCTE|nr:ABC transporter substrate-binding protein [Candidatus Tectomicrobia bacterium]